jgi:DNA-directed RNA polymerase subunit M/transcription elongation factor TFIIS
MPNGVKAVTTIASMDFPQTGLVSPDHQGQVMMILQNCRDEDLTIHRCSSIGYIENVKNPYFDEKSVIKSNEREVKIKQNPQVPEPEPLSQEEKVKFIAQAKSMFPRKKNTSMKTCYANTMMFLAKKSKIWAKQIILRTKSN